MTQKQLPSIQKTVCWVVTATLLTLSIVPAPFRLFQERRHSFQTHSDNWLSVRASTYATPFNVLLVFKQHSTLQLICPCYIQTSSCNVWIQVTACDRSKLAWSCCWNPTAKFPSVTTQSFQDKCAVAAKQNHLTHYNISTTYRGVGRLCGLAVRVPGYRSIGPGSIPGATRFYEK
jgi:hypothetical protein